MTTLAASSAKPPAGALLVDSHCHLDLATEGGDPKSLIDQAQAQGVGYLLSVAVDLDSFRQVVNYACLHPCVFGSVGVHPNARPPQEPPTEELARLAEDPLVVAVGETGLDYYRSQGDLEWQQERFRRHIRAARTVMKPLIIHCREAKEDTLRLLEEEKASEAGGVMHCFVEDWETAQRAMDLNFYISFSGVVTFKNAQKIQEVAARLPLERLLVETDAPYLAPVPFRGKPNQPAYVRFVAEHIAKLRNIPLEVLAQASTRNFFRLFRGGSD